MPISEIFKQMPWNKKIAILRTSKGWTQETAAQECCTTKKVYWLWETGRNHPRKNSQRAIAMAFEIAQEEIFGSTDGQKQNWVALDNRFDS